MPEGLGSVGKPRPILSLLARARPWLGAALVLWQVGMIVYARFDPARYFCWAPHDVIWTYEPEVVIDGRALTRQEMKDRYKLKRPGYEEHSIEHLFRALAQFERTYGKGDDARIRVLYRKNGGPAREWTWP